MTRSPNELLWTAKNGITDACSTADCCPLLTICPICCPRHAPDMPHTFCVLVFSFCHLSFRLDITLIKFRKGLKSQSLCANFKVALTHRYKGLCRHPLLPPWQGYHWRWSRWNSWGQYKTKIKTVLGKRCKKQRNKWNIVTFWSCTSNPDPLWAIGPFWTLLFKYLFFSSWTRPCHIKHNTRKVQKRNNNANCSWIFSYMSTV